MKNYKYLLLFPLLTMLWGCYEDKGNYNYSEVAEITFENVPELIEAVCKVENLVITPTVISSIEGEIKEANPNFEFSYKLELKSGGTIESGSKWVVLNPNGERNLNVLASFPANTYLCWLSVKDVRTNIATSIGIDVKITSNTYEGWMVLCNEGDENRVRMDMLSVLSKERIELSCDILGNIGMPESKDAIKIGWYPNRMASPGDLIYCVTDKGSYKLNNETFATALSWEINYVDFIVPRVDEYVANYITLNSGSNSSSYANFCVTDKGNAYCQKLGTAGAAFELPINTSVRGGDVEYKVAPFIGVSRERPGNGKSALFYDIDNLRFVGWADGTADGMQTLTPLSDPEGAKFSFKTDKKLVYMESTRFSGGITFSILEDATGKRSIYGIGMAGTKFEQEYYLPEVKATAFEQAEYYAFHSQFPLMFYAVGTNVYMFNLGTQVTTPVIAGNEIITMLKFNLYEQPDLGYLNDKSEEFLARQFELMVGSYDNSQPLNGGTLTFYKVNGIDNTISKKIDYSGFAKIKDVVYRERR